MTGTAFVASILPHLLLAPIKVRNSDSPGCFKSLTEAFFLCSFFHLIPTKHHVGRYSVQTTLGWGNHPPTLYAVLLMSAVSEAHRKLLTSAPVTEQTNSKNNTVSAAPNNVIWAKDEKIVTNNVNSWWNNSSLERAENCVFSLVQRRNIGLGVSLHWKHLLALFFPFARWRTFWPPVLKIP